MNIFAQALIRPKTNAARSQTIKKQRTIAGGEQGQDRRVLHPSIFLGPQPTRICEAGPENQYHRQEKGAQQGAAQGERQRLHFVPNAGHSLDASIPSKIMEALDTLLNHIASCPSNVPEGNEGAEAFEAAPPAWGGTNCYEFFQAFFRSVTSLDLRAKIVIHELALRWMRPSLGDAAYEGDPNYPPHTGLAIINVDSYAGFIRDVALDGA